MLCPGKSCYILRVTPLYSIYKTVKKHVHGYWVKSGSDRKHLDDNPQYILRVTAKQKTMVHSPPLCLLLSEPLV